MQLRSLVICICHLLLLCGCGSKNAVDSVVSGAYARYFEISDDGKSVVILSPFDGRRDTLRLDEPMDNIICMSSSHLAALASLGADSLISGVSGIRYVTDPDLRSRYEGNGKPLYDVGYDTSLDYECIVNLSPDVLVAYTVSGAEPPYLVKLRSLGIHVIVLHDHLEEHPLARAEYVRLFGAMTGRLEEADSIFAVVRNRYESLCDEVMSSDPKKVLLNVPYGDAWYVPGAGSYMSRLIRDAGGEVLGALSGTAQSRVISMEQAYRMSQEADIWLNPGHCRSRAELSSIHQLFPSFGPLVKGLPVYNNTLRTTPGGGNDFWESGVMRPDLILSDLVSIFGSAETEARQELYYFHPLE